MPKALNYILDMKRLPIILVMLITLVFLGINYGNPANSATPPSKYEKILQIIGDILTQGHYSPKDINDEFSKKVFNRYFEELDSEKNIFLQSDIKSLEKYSTRIDDEIKGAPVQFFLEASKIFNTRATEATAIYKDILSKPF